MSNFDQVVTQWMSPENVSFGRARRACQSQVRGVSTAPSTASVQSSVRTVGVTSADSTGQLSPVSY